VHVGHRVHTCYVHTITTRVVEEMNIPWFVLVIAAVNKTQPFLRPYYVDTMVCLYAITYGVWWVVKHEKEWQCKLDATSGAHKLIYFQIMEAAATIPYAFASVYLMFELVIPMWVFYTCLVVGVFGRPLVDWRWKKQMIQLSLG